MVRRIILWKRREFYIKPLPLGKGVLTIRGKAVILHSNSLPNLAMLRIANLRPFGAPPSRGRRESGKRHYICSEAATTISHF